VIVVPGTRRGLKIVETWSNKDRYCQHTSVGMFMKTREDSSGIKDKMKFLCIPNGFSPNARVQQFCSVSLRYFISYPSSDQKKILKGCSGSAEPQLMFPCT
jgi:hypothetical protein